MSSAKIALRVSTEATVFGLNHRKAQLTVPSDSGHFGLWRPVPRCDKTIH